MVLKVYGDIDYVEDAFTLSPKENLRGVEWVHALFLFLLVLGKM